MKRELAAATAVAALGAFAPWGTAHAQVVGSYDNFDCFNDTDEETEGFEIDVEDVGCDDNTEGSASCDLTRVFPSNFASTPWVIRYGLPRIAHYDYTVATADPAHAYDQGHKGVLVTYAATWNGTQWVASQGGNQSGLGVAGNGTPHNPKPTITAGDSCWWYGQGAQYPTSGCDHFGISLKAGLAPGKITYHWKIPDPANQGQLINWAAEASIPPSPTLTYGGGGAPVVAVAEAPENPEPQWGPAYFVKVTTLYGKVDAQLAALQKVNIKATKTRKVVTYSVLQRPPAGQVGEKEDVENDNIPPKNVQVTKQYEYFVFNGVSDSETHEATCDTAYPTYNDALAGTNAYPNGDSCSLGGGYWTLDPISNAPVHVKSNKGTYIGAHINALNAQ